MKIQQGLVGAAVLAGALLGGVAGSAQTCTPQSQMKDADRDSLALAAKTLSQKIAAGDEAGVRGLTIAEFQKDFSGMGESIMATAPRVKGATPEVEQVYLLDASTMQKTTGGTAADAQFYCTLNQSPAEAEFSIPQLPPGRYGFAMVRMEGAAPWRLSYLLRQDGGQWQLAGLYPKALTAGGHDGLWYWQQARMHATNKEPWSAWLYLQEAQSLLLPANFVSSTHLEKLREELGTAAPPTVAGLSADSPLVVKGADGTEYRFTAIGVDDSLGGDRVDIAGHIKVDSLGDGAVARKRNLDAMAALVAAHPELRKVFHGVLIFAEVPGQNAYTTEQAMAEIK